MLVNYYSVNGCTYETYENKPVIFAPTGVDTDSFIIKYYFFQTNTGRWCHYLTKEEYDYLMSFPKDSFIVTFDNDTEHPTNRGYYDFRDKRKANIMCVISFILLVSSWLMAFYAVKILLSFGCWIISFILMIIVRVQYPKRKFGIVLSIIFIMVAVAFFFELVRETMELIRIIEDCGSCIGSDMS